MKARTVRMAALAAVALIVGVLAAPSAATEPREQAIEPSERLWEHIGFSMGAGRLIANPDSLMEHVEFRQAIAHALDRPSLAATMDIMAIDSYVDVYDPAISQGAWAQYDYNPTKAAGMLSDLCTALSRNCINDPPTVVLSVRDDRPDRVALANAVKPMLETIGISVTLDVIPWTDQINDLIGGEFDSANFGWIDDRSARSLIDTHATFDPAQNNIYGWGTNGSSVINQQTARFTELVGLMNTTTNQTQLTAYFNEAEEILAAQAVFIPLGYKLVCRGLVVTLMGTDGPDEINGTAEDDVIDGGPGDDIIRGLGGNDALCGGDGDDTLLGGTGNDELAGGDGNDLLRGNAGDDSLFGLDGDDRLQEGAGNDSLYGGAGKDKLWGGIGMDWLSGGLGNDQLRGGRDDDTLLGDFGTDRMWGDSGDDSIFGEGNSDFLYGGIGNDTLVGGDGNDRMFGWTGNDLMWGSDGKDQLRGQAGDDTLNGGPQFDWCSIEISRTSCEADI